MKFLKKLVKFILFESYRVMYFTYFLYLFPKSPLSYLIRRHLSKRYKFIIGRNTVLSQKLILPHPINIVIGEGVSIGNGCTIYQGVTLGQNKGKYPVISDDVIIYAGAIIVGDIVIGKRAIIGANTVVTKSIPSNAIVGGVPAKILGFRKDTDEFY